MASERHTGLGWLPMGAMSRTGGFKPPLRITALSKRHSDTIGIAGEIARAKNPPW